MTRSSRRAPASSRWRPRFDILFSGQPLEPLSPDRLHGHLLTAGAYKFPPRRLEESFWRCLARRARSGLFSLLVSVGVVGGAWMAVLVVAWVVSHIAVQLHSVESLEASREIKAWYGAWTSLILALFLLVFLPKNFSRSHFRPTSSAFLPIFRQLRPHLAPGAAVGFNSDFHSEWLEATLIDGTQVRLVHLRQKLTLALRLARPASRDLRRALDAATGRLEGLDAYLDERPWSTPFKPDELAPVQQLLAALLPSTAPTLHVEPSLALRPLASATSPEAPPASARIPMQAHTFDEAALLAGEDWRLAMKHAANISVTVVFSALWVGVLYVAFSMLSGSSSSKLQDFMTHSVFLLAPIGALLWDHLSERTLPWRWPRSDLVQSTPAPALIYDQSTLRWSADGAAIALDQPLVMQLFRDPSAHLTGLVLRQRGSGDVEGGWLEWRLRLPVEPPPELEALRVEGPLVEARALREVLWPALAFHAAARGEPLDWQLCEADGS